MKYIIADSDMQQSIELKKILDDYEILHFQGNYISISAVESYCMVYPPDIAFIRLGKAELNAFRLADLIRDGNPFSKIVFIGSQRENAVEAFEYNADGFILTPFDKKKIEQLLMQNLESKK